MKSRLAIIAAALAVIWPSLAPAHPAPYVIDLIWKKVGGKEQYKKVRYVEFTWASKKDGKPTGERKHLWDRYTGDYVLEMTDSNGDALKMYFNVETKQGVALRNGTVVEGDAAAKLLDRAYAVFINDTYWLLMPTKLEDYGARVQFTGHEGLPPDLEWSHMTEEQRREWARHVNEHEPADSLANRLEGHEGAAIVLHLWFDENVGLTPGDQYWLYVTHEGDIVKWSYKLEGGSEATWLWSDPKDCGMGITLWTRRVNIHHDREVDFPVVKFSDTMDHSVFEYGG